MIDLPPENMTCPATMHADKCKEHFMNCPKWICVQGEDPQTGDKINNYNCADAWLPVLMIENSKQQRGTQAAVESLRNEVVAGNERQELRLIDSKKRLEK